MRWRVSRLLAVSSMRCIECGASVDSTITRDTQGVEQLTRCPDCNEPADKYVEDELALVVIDLTLHRRHAFCHLLFNRLQNRREQSIACLKLMILYVAADAGILWRFIQSQSERRFSMLLSQFSEGPPCIQSLDCEPCSAEWHTPPICCASSASLEGFFVLIAISLVLNLAYSAGIL